MNPGRGSDPRFVMLLQAAAQLESQDEMREFLRAVCADNPALAAEVTETIAAGEDRPVVKPAGDPVGVGDLVAGRFQILRRLGEGGMAVVYEAIDTKLAERRALKFSKFGHSQSIPPETRSALRVTHDNICRIHEIHTASTSSGAADFISMEFIDGETLSSRLKRGPVRHPEAVEIARQLCRGVDAAHAAHILHRDLKSNNVMLARNVEGRLRVVITDFGLAEPLGTSTRPASSTLSGTPGYIAPERWKGAGATPGSDVYALGVILYELLTGRLPFPPGTAWDVRMTGLPVPPSRSDPSPDPRWDAIVLRCLRPDPAHRFASAAEVLKAVERTFVISYRRQWLAAAAALVLAAAPLALWRDRIWPPPFARLAVLPVTGSSGDQALDDAIRGGLLDVAARLESVGATSKRVVVIPLEESLRYSVNSPATARGRLRATHTLSAAVGDGMSVFSVRAAVTNTATGEIVRDFSGEFRPRDVAALSTSLAGVVTSALRLDKAPAASIAPAAYAFYAAGLASLRRTSRDFDAAIGYFQEALKVDSGSPLICGGLADAYLNKFLATNDGQWLKESSGYARQAETLHPDSPPVLLVRGRIEQAEGRPERAIELFHRAAELEPENSEAWNRTGLALQRLGRDAEATAALRRAVQLAPEYYSPRLQLGLVHFLMGRYSEAVDEWRIVSQLAPDLPEAHSNLGGALLALGKEQEAERELRASIALRETRAALNSLGVLLRYQHRDQEAVDVFERALRSGADDARLRLNLGNSLRRVGHMEGARENFRRANALARAVLLRDPRNAPARAQLAYTLVRLGSPALAADEALQAVRLGKSEYAVLFWAVMSFEALGRRADALALSADASPEQLKDLRRQPDLAEFSRDPKFLALINSRVSQLTNERK
jgi:eukaryotic-like serine/threonine-protein kinase